ncbi:cupin-like domain-containing protein [Pseudomonas sp. MWU15-20650]|uniref:cupin-like domain-containing protein n=1 Tax=Pseudomonas sp. MWU15-20650 TaxID=2933107 RepID=UPI00200C480B|nr:cupin-like domain-containing protein [Pseudomonas sp. MWU15-20650]
MDKVMKAVPASAEFDFPTIDLTHDPKIDRVTRAQYWADFLRRYYFVGRKDHGPYGSPACIKRTQSIEAKIREQSRAYGDGPTLPVPEVSIKDLSPENFHKIFLEPNTPVVFRGAAKDWEAVKKWTPEFFAEHYGDVKVATRVRGTELNEKALQYIDLPLSEVVENIRQGGSYYPGHTEDLFNKHPELRKELDLDTLGKYLSTRDKRIMSTQLFLSAGGVISGWHCTGGPNLFTMVNGVKKWTFVHPKHSMWMHPITRKDMFYAATMLDWRKSHDEIEADGYPLYRYIPKYTTTLEAGDVLFSPHWWWHCVETPVPSIAIASRAINKLVMGNKMFSLMWITSPRFRQTVLTVLKEGWGSDKATGAKLAFEFDTEEFVRRVSR